MTSLQFKYRLAVLLILLTTVVTTSTVFAKPPSQGPNDPSFDPLGEFEAFEEEPSTETVESVGQQSRQLDAQADLIDRIPVQGILQNAAGQPIANQTQSVTFRLYDAVDGAGQKCESVAANVQTDANGFFNSFIEGCAIKLGDKRVLDGQQLYLGIQVGNDAEMTPRRPLYPVPYAISLMPGAAVRGTVDTLEGTFYVTNNARGSSRKLRGAIRGYSTSGSNFGYGVYGRVQNPQGFGVYGRADSTDGVGVFGFALASNLKGRGVIGRSDSARGTGVAGLANDKTTVNAGVFGESKSAVGYGVSGRASSKDGTNYGVYGQADGDTGYGVSGVATSISGTVTYGVYGQAASNKGYGVYGTAVVTGVTGVVTSPVGSTYGVHGVSYSNSGHGVYGQSTNTGVGVMARSTAGNPLEAYGSVADKPVFYVENQGNVHTTGSYHCGKRITETVTMIPPMSGTVTAAQVGSATVITTINRSGLAPCLQDSSEADFAEMLPASNTALEPGDVLAINQAGELVRTENAYQSTVVGVYSTKPSYLGNSPQWGNDAYAPLALVGIVPVKASTENGPIQPGDLLVASTTPGHAMRASTDAPNGTVIGKALAGLNDNTGMIRMLVMLQ